MKKILITADISEMAEKVILKGVELAKELNAEYSVISVTDDTIMVPDTATFVMPQVIESQKEQASSTIRGILERNGLKPANVFFEIGDTVDKIIEKAGEYKADILVVGTHGRTGLDHLLLGSMAEKLIRTSPISIFVAKFKE